SVEPNNPADSAWPNSKIKITFNQRMRKSETQNAFSISPNINGTFSWENFGKTLVFTPTALLSLGVTYSVTIDSNAVNFNYVRLDGDGNGTPGGNYSFNFTTKTYSALNITNTYPRNGQVDISPSVEIKINFDSPIMQSTLTNNVLLFDGSNNNIPISNILYEENNGKGRISFNPASQLQYNSLYKIILKTGIKNTLGTPLSSENIIEFTTEQNNFVLGIIIDDLETIGGWKDPDYSGSTTGTDPNATTFAIVTNKKVSGSASGKITYVFTGNTGVCRTFNSNKPNIGNDPSKKFGMWIYGDLSYHYLEFWFYYNTSTNVTVRVDTIDWTGWKFIEIPISKIPGTGDKLFHSVVLIQNPNGEKSGAIYIDGIQTRTTTGLAEINPPLNFSLSQNFPNPFNSTTNFIFTLPAKSFVTLKVIDILGREVKTLIEEVKDAGVHHLNFDFNNLASGMYFYTLNDGKNSITRKMILVK
ncbi:MAG: Ig-like domain-containing protein, partial [Ignavibacteria bacterium]|nr:Ig-like domain-containing protein [Ignavibacteria bacterium]